MFLATDPAAATAVSGLVVICLIAVFYFVPTIIAFKRKHHNATAILVVNLFLGWTFIGWVVALIWSCTAVVRSGNQIVRTYE